MRNNLVMQFNCAECGNVLDLVLGRDEQVRSKECLAMDAVPKLPTGCELRAVPPVQIKPCRHCIEKYTGPAKKLMDAINELKPGRGDA